MKNITLSIVLTAAREPLSIKKALRNILNDAVRFLKNDFELITVIPDQDTFDVAKNYISSDFKKIKWVNIKDPYKGKPTALNLAFKQSKGEYILLSDGDVYIKKDSIPKLFSFFSDKKVGAVTGRAVSIDDRNSFWGYISHLLADAAHHKRMNTMTRIPSKVISKNPPFFVLSGYLSMIRNIKIELPKDCLVDDAYISYFIFNKGYSIKYEPDSVVYVKYPKTLKDWLDQKARSVGGYIQLWKYNVINESSKIRSFNKELEYIWFPIKYAKSFKEIIYSLILYFLRAYLWLRIFIERRILKKDFYSTWVRIESTK